jgi:tetratricopeptide (TPR) repeat protein
MAVSSIRSLSRETILALSALALIILFTVVGFASNLYHQKRTALALEWYGRGEADLKTHNARRAIDDFRTALVYSRQNDLYRLRLAEALIAAGSLDEARTYLLNVWDDESENGTVNLALGRLAARSGNISEAQRYYQSAIYGRWESDAEQHRTEARLELCIFLLGYGRTSEAQGELMALAGSLPSDPSLHTEVAKLFLEAQDKQHALDQFRAALRLDPKRLEALLGAGEIAFQAGDYRSAERYFGRALTENPNNARGRARLSIARLVLANDPFEPRLSNQERSTRVAQVFQRALARLEDCAHILGESLPPQSATPLLDLQQIYARAQKMRPEVRVSNLRRNPDLQTSALDLAFEAEELAAQRCGSPQGLDEALLLIARAHRGPEP